MVKEACESIARTFCWMSSNLLLFLFCSASAYVGQNSSKKGSENPNSHFHKPPNIIVNSQQLDLFLLLLLQVHYHWHSSQVLTATPHCHQIYQSAHLHTMAVSVFSVFFLFVQGSHLTLLFLCRLSQIVLGQRRLNVCLRQ
jgi:hypothetical protein